MVIILRQQSYSTSYCALQHYIALHNKIYFPNWGICEQELTLQPLSWLVFGEYLDRIAGPMY